MRNGIKSLALVALTAMLLATTAVASGGLAAAQTADTDTDLTRNETFQVSNDTESLRVTAENASDTLTVNIYENGTQVTTGTVNATSGGTDTFSFAALDSKNHSEYRVEVTSADPANTTVEYLEIVKIEAVSGGGGLLAGVGSGDVSPGMAIGVLLALLAVVALAMVMRG